ncbi:MAG TPA: hypothetical protein PK504_03990 [Ferruginibacter sp.]|nr:hypothetical protein [Ferruginibacter sp.]
MRWLHFILSHSVFIAFCAVALCYQTYTLLHLQHNNAVYWFIFFSTLSSYNFYWLISKYSFSSKTNLEQFVKRNISYLIFFICAAIGMLWATFYIWHTWHFILIAILLTLIYSMPLWPFTFAKGLRKLGFLKTTLLAFTWSYVTVCIPAFVDGTTDMMAINILLLARFFFMLMLCAIFDMRDMQMDKIRSLRSLATDVSKKALNSFMLLSFILYMAAGMLVRYHFNDNLQLAAFVITGLVVWYVYKLSSKNPGYIFYYFVVDGLMLFSALATFVAEMLR